MARKNFHHPYEPYEIQQDFMERLYDCIDRGGVGIFESPTGTGKSLSLICGALTWLREHKRRQFDDAVAAITIDDDEPAWMMEHARESRRKELSQARMDLEKRLRLLRDEESKWREQRKSNQPALKKRRANADESEAVSMTDEDQFALDDYESDHESFGTSTTRSLYNAQTTALMEQIGILMPNKDDDRSLEHDDELKLIFCSRTHSQLSQFVGELSKVRLPPSVTGEDGESNDPHPECVKQLSLGSRKNLCINPKVSKLRDQSAVNERCIELQQAKTATDKKCQFVPKKDQEAEVLDFRDYALSTLRDIEDLAELGRRLNICPYYASRSAINPSEVLTLPYPLLLQKTARDALGLSLKNHVVIIDEAHNLLDAVEGTYSAEVSDHQLQRAKDSLIMYLHKFRNKLKGRNRVYVTQVVRVLDSLLLSIKGIRSDGAGGGVIDPSGLLHGKGIDQINLSKLIRYITESKLARKVEGYAAFVAGTQGSKEDEPPKTPNLTLVQNFLASMMNPSKEGQFFWSVENDRTLLRYMLLDPSEHFRGIVEDARAVILAGGTMSPMEDYQQQLFPYISDLTTFSCGHLIPAESLMVRTIVTDDQGPLTFNYKTRKDASTYLRVVKALVAVAPKIEGGLIVFVPSYGFLDDLVACLHSKSHSFLQRLQRSKPLFYDSRKTAVGEEATASSEAAFQAYNSAIVSNSKRGAILFSVLGGKLSEGINFSDDLGRCVMVVGLPFPNVDTPEWKAKMAYIDNKFQDSGTGQSQAVTRPAQTHVENVCMRAVNQAIGRVIRHKNDWASILLMDSRYAQPRIRCKLPAWILKSLPPDIPKTMGAMSVSGVEKDLAGFFQRRQLRQD